MGAPASDRVIPRWIERVLAFGLIVGAGALTAMLGAWMLIIVGVGGDAAFAAYIAHFDIATPAAIGCGVVLALAALGNRARTVDLRRAAAAAAVLFGLGVTAFMVPSIVHAARDFDAAAFRAAHARGDHEALEMQAYLAVEEDALVGKSPEELRALLGAPDRRSERRRLWIWDLGMINDFLGPGDGGALYVQFERGRARVRAAKVGTHF